MVVGAHQSFQVFRQSTRFLENNRHGKLLKEKPFLNQGKREKINT